MKHRCDRRYACDQMVLLRAGEWRALARVLNISSSGAYLRCVHPASGIVRVCIDFGQEPNRTRLLACVVRRTTEGIGVEWDGPIADSIVLWFGQESPDSVPRASWPLPSAGCRPGAAQSVG